MRVLLALLLCPIIGSPVIYADGETPEEKQAITALKKAKFFIFTFDKKDENSPAKTAHCANMFAPHTVDDTLKHLSSLKKLEMLRLFHGHYTGKGLEAIKDLVHLKALVLSTNRKIGDEGLRHLKKLQNIERLSLQNIGITDEGMQHVAKLKNLTHLDLTYSSISGEGITHLKGLKLKALNLKTNNIDNEALKVVGSFSDLEFLSLAGTKVTDKGLAHLAGLKKLKSIDLGFNKINGSGLVHLKDCPLTLLNLYNCALTDEGIKPFAHFTMLKELYLSSNKKLTDRSLAVLEDLPRLRYVNISDTSITKEGKAAFNTKRPGVRFQ